LIVGKETRFQTEKLDFDYLNQWVQTLQLTDLLIQAFQQTGLLPWRLNKNIVKIILRTV